MEKIGIFCSASENIDKMYFESARRIGEWIGQTGKTLIYGGANLGLMECVARTVKAVSYTHLTLPTICSV